MTGWTPGPVRAVLASIVLAMVAGACAPTQPSPSPGVSAEAGAPIRATVSRDGVIVVLTLDRDRLPTGDLLRARAIVRNDGPGPVSWRGGGCGLQMGFGLRGPDIVQPPPGRDWPDIAGLVKWAALPSGVSLTGFVDPALWDRPGMWACTADLRIEEIPGGATETVDVVWSATTSDGAPTPPGAYRASFEFPFLGRVAAEQFRGDIRADRRSIIVELPLQVTGAPYAGISATAAIDAALADPRVALWLHEEVTRQLHNGASIAYRDGVWTFEVKVEGGPGSRVRIDATSGQVLSVGPAG